MSQINYSLVGKLQRREKFRRQNEDKINSYLLTYCENYDKGVENVAQFMQNTKKQIFEDLYFSMGGGYNDINGEASLMAEFHGSNRSFCIGKSHPRRGE